MSRFPKIAATVALLFASTGLAHSAEVTPPESIAKAGKIVYCSSISAPPLEFYNEANEPVGSDIELGQALAEKMGVTAEYKNIAFSALIPSLLARQCDAIISQLFNKPKRREVVDFVDYMYSSQSFLVPVGNPKNIQGIEDISGLKIAAQNGTTIQSLVEEQNKKFEAEGKAPAGLTVFPKDSDARQALQIGQVDAFGTTLESAAYFLKKEGEVFSIGGEPFNKIVTGIATHKGDPAVHDAVQKAFDAIKADGTYMEILTKWGLQGDAME